MPTTRYKLKDGTRVPGVTTIIGSNVSGGKLGALMKWANQLGLEGKNHTQERDAAADAGTLAHAMIEADIRGDLEFVATEYPDEVIAKAERCFETYTMWRESNNLEPIKTELSLVSEKYRYGGTMDYYGKINHVLVEADWKTGKRLYSDVLMQHAAYRHLLLENDMEPPDEYRVVLFNEDEVDERKFVWEELLDSWEMFLAFRNVYELRKRVDKQI